MDREAIKSARGVAGDNEFASDEEAALRFYLAEAMEGADKSCGTSFPRNESPGRSCNCWMRPTHGYEEDNRVIRFTQGREGVPMSARGSLLNSEPGRTLFQLT